MQLNSLLISCFQAQASQYMQIGLDCSAPVGEIQIEALCLSILKKIEEKLD